VALNSLQLSARPDKPENLHIKRKKPAAPASPDGESPASPASPEPGQASVSHTPKPFKRKPKLPSRRLVRHVLRHRVLACQALFRFLEELDLTDGRVTASPHLASAYGHPADISAPSTLPAAGLEKSEGPEGVTESEEAVPEPNGWRSGREVVWFLRSRGAGVGMVKRKEEWGGLSSEGETEEIQEEGERSS